MLAEAGSIPSSIPAKTGPVELQIVLSLVSTEEARANLDAELPAWAFDDTAKKTAAAWNALTRRVESLLGGREKAVAKLEQLFEQARTEWDELDTTDPLKSADSAPTTGPATRATCTWATSSPTGEGLT